MTFAAELAQILETTEKNVFIRASKLRIMPACGRCLGSGRYSFNLTHGDRCFGCNGSGQRMPNAAEESEVIEAAKATKEDGRFADYMAFIGALSATKNAAQKVMNAWKATGISAQYDWRKSAEYKRIGTPEFKRDNDMSIINKKMSDAYTSVQSVWLNYKSETYQADVLALAEALKGALATVEAARVELVEYLANEGA